MQQSDIPARFSIPFANNAGAGYIRPIPVAHVAASGSDAPASLYDGFPPETFVPRASGGIPPNGKDFNGLLNQVTAWARWQAAGGAALFDSAFSSAIGGYPKNAVLASAVTPGTRFVSLIDNNTNNPDSVLTGWQSLAGAALTVSGSDWRRVASDGFIEIGGQIFIGQDATATVTFSTPFPTACFGAWVSWVDSTIGSGSGQGSSGISSPTTTGFTIYNDGRARTHLWNAKGN